LQKKIIVIGAGFSGLANACFLAKAGYAVTVLEKQDIPGGRARTFSSKGFTFDMGPSWYWMPDVFERFFNLFGKKVNDYYELIRLDPSYVVHYEDSTLTIPANYTQLKLAFEKIEEGSGIMLDSFLKEALYKYEVGINKLVHKPGLKVSEFVDMDVLKGVLRLDVFTNMKKHVAKFFKNKKLQQLMEFPVLFLGATANNIPALYSLMNYADIKLGTWFPKGGMYKIVDGMHKLATELGVQFVFNSAVTAITVEQNRATKVFVNNKIYQSDAVVAAADYHFVEQNLLEEKYRNYTEAYWNKKQLAPSCLLYYVGINKKLQQPFHHQLFFDTDFEKHANEIYTSKIWPKNPLFYVSTTTATDITQAPEGCENLFFLIPIAAGLQGDNEQIREKYFNLVLQRFEQRIGESVKENIVYKKSFGVTDFVSEYGAYKGNAYGLANTLMQTAILKPKCINKKVKNLFYTGQLTIPGPGVPPSLISGEIVAKLVDDYLKVRNEDASKL
jgi:phytoene desaturase